MFSGVLGNTRAVSAMEDLAQSWNKLTLSKREGPGCCLTNEDSVKEYSIAAKFLTRRTLNIDVVARTFRPLWRARNGFKIQAFDDHKILFTFDNNEDVDRILNSEPWSFDKNLVVMQRYESDTSLQEISFNKTTLWVQVHGLPARFMSREAAKKICGVVGEVVSPSETKAYDGGNFMRIQVSIDLGLPLCQGHLISLNKNKDVWVSFKYESITVWHVSNRTLLGFPNRKSLDVSSPT